jgi:ATP-binding cassette, subfamily B, bacterial
VVGILFVSIYTWFMDWRIAVSFLLTIPLLSWISLSLSLQIKKIQEKIVKQTVDVSGSITESLRNIELVKSLGLVEQESKRIASTSEQLIGLELEKIKRVRGLSFLQGTSINFLRTVIFVLLLFLVWNRDISVGEFLSAQFFTFFIFNPLYELGNTITQYRETQASLSNFDTLMQSPVEECLDDCKVIDHLDSVVLSSVTYSHPDSTGEMHALEKIDLTLEAGKSYALVGPSGAGKSTVIKLISGLYTPSKGHVLYNGISSVDIAMDSMRSKLGIVTQDSYLFSGTIRENLLFVSPDSSEKDLIRVLQEAQCASILDRADNGLDTTIGEMGIKLSGGEKQRVAIARALLRDPDMLIFDEATSALDSLTETEIISTIKHLETSAHKKRITLSIAHRLSTIQHVDTIFVFEKGKIVERGNHAQLLSEKGLYYAMWRQQVGKV